MCLHALVWEKKYCRTRVMSYQKRVGLAGDSHLRNLVHTFCQHFTENPLFIFNKKLAIIISIPPIVSIFSLMIEYWPLSYLFSGGSRRITLREGG